MPKFNPHKPQRRSANDHDATTIQAHLVAASGEFVGTFFFLWIGYAGHLMAIQQATENSGSLTVLITAFSYGFALLVNVWAFFRISGGLFNPAVTLGLVLAGMLNPIRGIFLFAAQFLACMCAGGLAEAMFPGSIASVNTVLAPGVSIAQGVFIEMFLTAQLIIVVFMLAVEKSKDTPVAPVGIGLTLFVALIPGVYFTGGSLNPVRSFGCAVAGRTFPGYHWIYWIGPVLGSLLAAGYYRFVKYFHYEEANPGQDSTGHPEMA